jgi:glycosyltransferase involved in cell wall biosynthesis
VGLLRGRKMSSTKAEGKIYFLTQYFYPDVASTAQLLTELAEDLSKYGLRVEVFTAQPSYNKSQKLLTAENYNGIIIRRVWNTHFHRSNILGRLLNEFTFVISLIFALFFARLEKGVFLIGTNPPLLPVVGLILKRIKKFPYIYFIYDIYPDIAVKLGYLSKNSILTKFFEAVNRRALVNADKIIVIGECIKDVIEKKVLNYPQCKKKIEVIHNWADEKKIFPVPKESNRFIKEHGLEGKFVILHSGNLGISYPLELLIEAANKLKSKNIIFLFIGNGGKKPILEKMAKEMELKNVKFLPYQDKGVLSYSLSSGDVSIVTMEEEMEGLRVPSKLYSFLAAGRPILGIVPKKSEVALIVERAKCGLIVELNDADRFCSTIEYLYNNQSLLAEFSVNARKYFESNFTRSMATKKYLEVIKSVLNSPKKKEREA